MFFSSFFSVVKNSLSALAVGGVVFSGSLFPQAAQAYLPSYTTTGSTSGTYPGAQPSSFGFFFDTNASVTIDGLGFAAQQGWTQGSYVVSLFSYVNGGGAPGDYTQIATQAFTAGTAYTLENNYYWQSIPFLTLPDTFTTDPSNLTGYVITVIGDFSATTGNAQYEEGTAAFDPRFLNGGNGYNDVNDVNMFYPIPIYNGPAGTNGYFNANMSIVPGPLPVLGAAAGFGWTRRLRKRIRASK